MPFPALPSQAVYFLLPTAMQSSNTSSAHTPGPWTADNAVSRYPFRSGPSQKWDSSYRARVRRVATVQGKSPEHALANARLVAAAPDLLSACRVALEEIEQWNEVMGGSEDPRTHEAIRQLREAIARAEGTA